MLQSNKEKEISKADMVKKVEAYKTINQVLVKTNAEFMATLANMLTEKEINHKELEKALQEGSATEEQNAEYIYLGGYIQCLKDILYAKKAKES